MMTEKTAPGVVRVERPEDAPKVFQDAFNAGDLDGLVNLFEPEAVLFLGPGQVATGPTKIQELIGHFLGTLGRWEIALISHNRVDDIALNTIEHTLYSTAPDGSTNTLSVRAAIVFRRQADGSWRFLIDNGAPFG
jgi:uncharacterized protein (TIGR02246 family)